MWEQTPCSSLPGLMGVPIMYVVRLRSCVVSFMIGRSPNVAGLNLEAAGVAVIPAKGHIIVDEWQVKQLVEVAVVSKQFSTLYSSKF